jgi:hypothetical protein
MDNIRIPLCAVDPFLATFLPPISSKSSPGNCNLGSGTMIRGRSIPGFHEGGQLRIFIKNSELVGRDITRLVKHKTKYPEFNIAFEQLGPKRPEIQGLDSLVQNSRPQWLHWIRTNVVSSIRLNNKDPYQEMIIVVKERYAPQWMRTVSEVAIPDGFLATLGLDQIPFWDVRFRVDYT